MTARVLIPVNDQESALIAIECAMARRWPEGTLFMLATVVEDLANTTVPCSTEHMEILASEQTAYRAQMRDWLEQAKSLFSQVFPDTETVIECGRVSQTICDIALRWEADYVLIGSHSFGLQNRLALKGIAAQVLAYAPCSVEAIRFSKIREWLRNYGTIDLGALRVLSSRAPRKILVASDLSVQAGHAIDWVAQQEWSQDSAIRLVTVVLRSAADSGLALRDRMHLFTEEQKYHKHIEHELRLQANRALGKRKGLKLECFLIQADSVLQGVLDEVDSWGAEMVVVGAQGANRTDESRAGSTAVRIVEQLECSTVAVRPSERNAVHFSWFESLQK